MSLSKLYQYLKLELSPFAQNCSFLMKSPLPVYCCFKRGTKKTKGTVKLTNRKQTDNAMRKDKQTNNSTHDTTQKTKE